MKKLILLLFMMMGIAFGIVGCASSSIEKFDSRYADEFTSTIVDGKSKADIWVEGSTMYYNGEIGFVEYELFEYVLEIYANTPITKIIINSPGGDTVMGRNIGNYIFDNKIDVEVDTICFSSCANYIFTAGKNKTIQTDSFVGWHGSEHQLILKAEFYNKTPYEQYKTTLESVLQNVPKKERDNVPENFIEDQVQIVLARLSEEVAFFEKIGVNIHLTLVGILEYEDIRDEFPAYQSSGYGGWTYSIEDMKLFGLDNVMYLGDTPYPSESASKEVFQADIGDYDIQRVFDYNKLQ